MVRPTIALTSTEASRFFPGLAVVGVTRTGTGILRHVVEIEPHDAPALIRQLVALDEWQMSERGPDRLLVRDAIERGIFRYNRADPDEVWKSYDEAIDEARTSSKGYADLDCEDLAALAAAELRVTGADPRAFPHVYRANGRTYHVVTGSPRFGWLDPSVAAGMGQE